MTKYFKLKDNTSRQLQSNIVNLVNYLDCEAECLEHYQHNNARLCQHKMVKDG